VFAIIGLVPIRRSETSRRRSQPRTTRWVASAQDSEQGRADAHPQGRRVEIRDANRALKAARTSSRPSAHLPHAGVAGARSSAMQRLGRRIRTGFEPW
jgi:hypothetical protein